MVFEICLYSDARGTWLTACDWHARITGPVKDSLLDCKRINSDLHLADWLYRSPSSADYELSRKISLSEADWFLTEQIFWIAATNEEWDQLKEAKRKDLPW